MRKERIEQQKSKKTLAAFNQHTAYMKIIHEYKL